MAADAQVFHPGQIVPRSGIYRCTEGHHDHSYESTDVKGHRFPPAAQRVPRIGLGAGAGSRAPLNLHHLSRCSRTTPHASAACGSIVVVGWIWPIPPAARWAGAGFDQHKRAFSTPPMGMGPPGPD